jgi:hypothetical protein
MANGENVKVVQEFMRHANCRCTLEIYSQARIQAKREAQHRVGEMIVPREREATDVEEPFILAKTPERYQQHSYRVAEPAQNSNRA